MKDKEENGTHEKAGGKNTRDILAQKTKALKISPWIAGAVIGFLAAALQRFASMTRPPAYGFCMACHVRDLGNFLTNQLFRTNLFTAPVLPNAVFIPVLTVIGVLLGAFVAAVLSKEFRFPKMQSPILLLKMFFLGFLVMIFALLLGACPIRASLRVAHGDVIALIGLICMGIGAVLATRFVLERKIKTGV